MTAHQILGKILMDDGCWLWGGSISGGGYGQASVNGRPRRAHRAVYEIMVGPIPVGMQLDHLCRTPACVKPDHLEPVTEAENKARAKQARRTCLRGHPWSEINTYYHKNIRNCRVCARMNVAKSRARHNITPPWGNQ